MVTQINFSAVDYLVFVGLLIVSSLIGVFFGWRDRKQKSNAEFLTGGRNLSVFPVAMSLSASFMSTNTILGTPAEVYSLGTQFVWNMAAFTVGVILAVNVFMPIYYDLQLTSVNKYLLKRFRSNVVRLTGSVGFILATLPYMGVVLFGPALALSQVTPLSVRDCILIVGLSCTFYTSIGGIKAVIWTDVVQCSLMLLGLMIVIIRGSYEAGGILEPFKIAAQDGRLTGFNWDFNIYRADTTWACFFGTVVGWSGTYCVKQTQVQRYCCLPSKKDAARTLYGNIPGVLAIGLMAIWCGIILFAKYGHCDPVLLGIVKRTDQLMPYYVMETMSHIPGLPGLFVACVFSGALSTLSSGYNAQATVLWDDFLKHSFENYTPKAQLRITKIIAAMFGILSICIAFTVGRLGTVLQGSMALSGAITGPLLAMFCLGIFVPFVNAKGAFLGLLTGISCCLFISTGLVLNPRPKVSLPTFIDKCPPHMLEGINITAITPKLLPWEYQPEGWNQIFHVSYLYMATIGFLITMVIGVVVSLLTGIEKEAEPTLMLPLLSKLCPSCMGPQPEKPEREMGKRSNSAGVVVVSSKKTAL
ncbi:Sodium-coupled monocarboxylate transporter 2 [Halotydeus destructor]|nr:Sodium-coupled monocarboxylate transporter 2 [Halotydeus destructor]